jgi:hypothetical protein
MCDSSVVDVQDAFYRYRAKVAIDGMAFWLPALYQNRIDFPYS